MLVMTDFASWQQRILLYCQGKENGVNMWKLIDEGPFQMGPVRETMTEGTKGALHLGLERPRVYSNLTYEEKDRVDRIKDKGTMHRVQVQLVMGELKTELGGQDNIVDDDVDEQHIQDLALNVDNVFQADDCDAFDYDVDEAPTAQTMFMANLSFAYPVYDEASMSYDSNILSENQGETIHAYYVQFAKLINDMRNIKMTMSRMQLNSKFVNNMLPEWGRFVTAPYSQSSTTPPSTYVPPHLADNAHLDSGLSLTENLIKNLTNTLALLTQSYKTFISQTNNQLRTSSNTRNQATVQDGKNRVRNANPSQARQIKCYNCNGIGHIARNCTQPKRPHNSNYFKDKMLLMQAKENGVALDEEQLLFLVDDYDAFDFDVNEALTAQTMFKANLSSTYPVYDEAGLSYDSDILSEEQVELYERRARFELTKREQKINEKLRIVITDRNIKEETLKRELHSVKLQLASTINRNKLMVEEVKDRLFKQDQSLQTVHMLCRPKPYYNKLNKVAIGYKNPLCLTPAKQVQPALYNGHEIINNNHIPAIVHNTEDTLEIAKITRRKMNDKMKDPKCVKHKVKIAPHDY
nr:hypothetical protein [Tanacetum cinerariifolium]